MEKMFIQVDEVCEILGVSRSKAYQLMRQLNAELEKRMSMRLCMRCIMIKSICMGTLYLIV